MESAKFWARTLFCKTKRRISNEKRSFSVHLHAHERTQWNTLIQVAKINKQTPAKEQ